MSLRALCCLLLACSLAAPTGVALAGTVASSGADAGATPTTPADAGDLPGAADGRALADQTAPNNTTNGSVRHRDPAEVGEDGSVEDLRRWLVGQLAGRLSEGAVQLSEGEYDLARRVLGDQYSKRLDQLVDVAGDTETTRTLNRTRENQRETTDSVREYRETLTEYREARENGNTTRARELGRDLERISERVATNANETRSGYDRLGNRTGANFTEASTAIETVSENVSEEQAEIRDDLFTGTNLTATADGETISFTRMLTVEGRLLTENGTAVADETVRIGIGNRNYTVETDEEGRFTVAYRPVTLPLNATNLTVAYRPAGESAYLRSSTTLPVEVQQVTPTVAVNRTPAAVAYNDTLTVAGRVSADEVGGPAPVAVFVGDRRVARGVASANGSYTLTARLPADVDPGERTVRAAVPLDGRALARAEATTTVTVTSTATELSLNASQAAERRVSVNGRLTTDEGAPLAGRTVRIEHEGSELTTVRTDDAGRYGARVEVPESVPDNGTLALNATFAGTGTNLDASRANASVDLIDLTDDEAGGGAEYGDGVGGTLLEAVLSNRLALGAFLLGLLVLAAVGAYAVLTGSDEDEATDLPGGTGEVVDASGEAERAAASTASMAALLDRAHTQIASGSPDAGVITLYAATRRLLGEGLPPEYGRTHWEFYRNARERLDGSESGVLRELTEAYERAAFSPDHTPAERAQALVDRLREFHTGEDRPGD